MEERVGGVVVEAHVHHDGQVGVAADAGVEGPARVGCRPGQVRHAQATGLRNPCRVQHGGRGGENRVARWVEAKEDALQQHGGAARGRVVEDQAQRVVLRNVGRLVDDGCVSGHHARGRRRGEVHKLVDSRQVVFHALHGNLAHPQPRRGRHGGRNRQVHLREGEGVRHAQDGGVQAAFTAGHGGAVQPQDDLHVGPRLSIRRDGDGTRRSHGQVRERVGQVGRVQRAPKQKRRRAQDRLLASRDGLRRPQRQAQGDVGRGQVSQPEAHGTGPLSKGQSGVARQGQLVGRKKAVVPRSRANPKGLATGNKGSVSKEPRRVVRPKIAAPIFKDVRLKAEIRGILQQLLPRGCCPIRSWEPNEVQSGRGPLVGRG